MDILTCATNVDLAPDSRAHTFVTEFRGWTTDLLVTTNPTVMGAKPYRQRPQEASPPT